MTQILKVTYQDIEQLNAVHLTELLGVLLNLESSVFKIPSSAVQVPLKIIVSDGGEDARIQWEEGPEKTLCLTNSLNLSVSSENKI